MPDLNERDTKLVQYLNEAYGKEKELEAALEAHVGMTERAPYKKRLRTHLRETKGHSRKVEQRIKQLGGSPQAVQSVVGRATAAVKGPVHALRGTGAEERQLKNAKTEYSEEAEEIVRLGLKRLVQRRVLAKADGRVRAGSHPHGRDLLAYYARSLAALDLPASRALEARAGTTP